MVFWRVVEVSGRLALILKLGEDATSKESRLVSASASDFWRAFLRGPRTGFSGIHCSVAGPYCNASDCFPEFQGVKKCDMQQI